MKRLLRMSPHEIFGRGVEEWHGLTERLLAAAGAATATPRSAEKRPGQHLDALRKFQARPFGFAHDDLRALSQSFRQFFPGRAETILQEAEAIRSGVFRLFGETIQFDPDDPDWHLDWKTGERFPLVFYRDIQPNSAAGIDPKRVWETNRQQFLVTLGKAYLLTGEPKYAQSAANLIQSWIRGNAPYLGINWKEGLEVGLRLLSWLWTVRMLAGASALDDETCERIGASISLQWRHIVRHHSRYSSPNTHLLGEALAVFVLGIVLPDLRPRGGGAAWGLGILEEQLLRQVADDGSHREKSAYYHCYALEMYLLATALGRQHGVEFSSYWNTRVEKMADFLLHIVRPDGSLARFGDDDGGKTIRLGEEGYYRPRALLAIAATLFERGDFKNAAGPVPEEVFWIFGPEGMRHYGALPATEPRQKTVWFPDAQLGAKRSDWKANGLWLACQQQPMGMLTAGHSHAAPLSFELMMNGQMVLVDPGTFTYVATGPWRDHFRSAEAHNCVQIQGEGGFLPGGPFRWRRVPSLWAVTPVAWSDQRLEVGYLMARRGSSFRHTRAFAVESNHSVTVQDSFEGQGRTTLVFWFHFAAAWRLRQKSPVEFEAESEHGWLVLLLEQFEAPKYNVWRGSEQPVAGWVSLQYDQKAAADVLSVEEEMPLPAVRKLRLLFKPRGL